MMERIIFFYFLFINGVTFLIYGYDKWVAKFSSKRRISEKELHTFSIIGGFLGATLAMALFHHKIAKSSFLIGKTKGSCLLMRKEIGSFSAIF